MRVLGHGGWIAAAAEVDSAREDERKGLAILGPIGSGLDGVHAEALRRLYSEAYRDAANRAWVRAVAELVRWGAT